jgi:hypothetical protein
LVEHADLGEETLVINEHQPEWANSDFMHTQVPVSKEIVPGLYHNSSVFLCPQIVKIATYFEKVQVS